MLTININDVQLEKRIAEKARSIGKSTQEIVKELLTSALPETSQGLYYQKLNPKDHGYFIDTNVEEEIFGNSDKTLFLHVEDSAKYTENLRKNAWRK